MNTLWDRYRIAILYRGKIEEEISSARYGYANCSWNVLDFLQEELRRAERQLAEARDAYRKSEGFEQ